MTKIERFLNGEISFFVSAKKEKSESKMTQNQTEPLSVTKKKKNMKSKSKDSLEGSMVEPFKR